MFRNAARRFVPLVSSSRGFASEASGQKSGGSGGIILGLAGAGVGLYAAREQGYLDTLLGAPSNKIPTAADYAKVRSAIADVLDSDTHDDGSYGPILVRLAWHTSGTYDKATGTGGSNGATMRFNPESGWGANAGLKTARDVLEPVKKAFPWISYADLWTLGGAVAIEEMGGPEIPWRPGRSDKEEKTHVPLPDGRLPDGDKGADHVRDIFYRMGFNDQEIVALVGAHALGRCHPTSSGWDGPWTRAPTTFSNEYFVQLADNKWKKKKWSGPEQYEDPTGDLMMLPADMCLLWDRGFKKYVMEYKNDEDKFRADFAKAFSKLLELGVPFASA